MKNACIDCENSLLPHGTWEPVLYISSDDTEDACEIMHAAICAECIGDRYSIARDMSDPYRDRYRAGSCYVNGYG